MYIIQKVYEQIKIKRIKKYKNVNNIEEYRDKKEIIK
jgi:hypothetical protein